jgi:hypothetical protein
VVGLPETAERLQAPLNGSLETVATPQGVCCKHISVISPLEETSITSAADRVRGATGLRADAAPSSTTRCGVWWACDSRVYFF